jgi:hypothetical protein
MMKWCHSWNLNLSSRLILLVGYLMVLSVATILCCRWYLNDFARGKPKYWDKNLFQCQFVHHKSHVGVLGLKPELLVERQTERLSLPLCKFGPTDAKSIAFCEKLESVLTERLWIDQHSTQALPVVPCTNLLTSHVSTAVAVLKYTLRYGDV